MAKRRLLALELCRQMGAPCQKGKRKAARASFPKSHVLWKQMSPSTLVGSLRLNYLSWMRVPWCLGCRGSATGVGDPQRGAGPWDGVEPCEFLPRAARDGDARDSVCCARVPACGLAAYKIHVGLRVGVLQWENRVLEGKDNPNSGGGYMQPVIFPASSS